MFYKFQEIRQQSMQILIFSIIALVRLSKDASHKEGSAILSSN